jgi:type II secretory pathway component PulF
MLMFKKKNAAGVIDAVTRDKLDRVQADVSQGESLQLALKNHAVDKGLYLRWRVASADHSGFENPAKMKDR